MDKQRIDKWLWAARFFKTRSIATDSVSKGRIAVDGQTVKPSRQISVGDNLRINKNPYFFEVKVLGLNNQRRSATEAQTLYEESEASIAARELARESHKNERLVSSGLKGSGRPNKRQRRQIIQFQDAVFEEKLDNKDEPDKT